VAEGTFAFASGVNSQATGYSSIAMGFSAVASGSNAIALGQAQATGDKSLAVGMNSVASGIYSTAIGGSCQATEQFAVALGAATIASGQAAMAMGNTFENNVDYSLGIGDSSLDILLAANDNSYINNDKNFGIGTNDPQYKLDVHGDINTTGDILKSGVAYNHPDYVFEPGYQLLSLAGLRTFIDENKHLPGVPSAKEVQDKGVKMFEQGRLTLEKLEEAYLYIFQLEKRIAELEKKLAE